MVMVVADPLIHRQQHFRHYGMNQENTNTNLLIIFIDYIRSLDNAMSSPKSVLKLVLCNEELKTEADDNWLTEIHSRWDQI